MRLRKWDSDGDIRFGHGQADYWRDAAEGVAQAVAQRLRLMTGEWYLDTAEGTPYVGGVLGKYTEGGYDPVIRTRILETEGVLSLDSYSSSLDRDARALSVAATITTIYGQAIIQEVL
jgi:hypothetical protein